MTQRSATNFYGDAVMPRWRSVIGLILLLAQAACSRCALFSRTDDGITSIGSEQITLSVPKPPEPEPPPALPPVLKTEAIAVAKVDPPPPEKPSETEVTPEDILSSLGTGGPPPVPPGTNLSEDLTMRLKERMAESYGGDMAKVPKAKIYLGSGGIDDFIKFYEERGYHVQRVAVPVKRILQPVLRDRPELADRIHLDDYRDDVIHQVMVEGTGISAADRYIDPDSFQVVDRLFVTEMPLQ